MNMKRFNTLIKQAEILAHCKGYGLEQIEVELDIKIPKDYKLYLLEYAKVYWENKLAEIATTGKVGEARASDAMCIAVNSKLAAINTLIKELS